jgi:hypothetical protein
MEVEGFPVVGELAEEGVVAVGAFLLESVEYPILDLVADGFDH